MKKLFSQKIFGMHIGSNSYRLKSIMIAYMYLFFAVILGTASNSFAKSAEGFSKLIPSILSMITIILCMYCLSQVMKSIPVGITYAIFAGLCIIATVLIGIIKFNQIPNIYSFIGLTLIILGALIVNLLDKS